jgi:ribonuclease D
MNRENSSSRHGRPSGFRSAHRARAHDLAHADEQTAPPPGKIPDHPLIPRGAADLIIDPDAFDELLAHLRSAGLFAYDSEFIGELTYHPKLCLIQVASASRVALIDPLLDLDLNLFWELIADPAIEKIVHAGAQDIEPVMRHINKPCANIFDTQVAAGFAGMSYPVALSKLVQELIGVRLGKGLTFTHWDQRPLSAMQLRYAADDVRYLPALRDAIGKRLDSLGHAQWAADECAAMCDPRRYIFDPDTAYTRIRGAGALSKSGLAVLRELTILRDSAARSHDVPPRAFLKDEVLLDLARSPVKSIEKLGRVKGLPRPVEAQHGKEIVDATLRALAMPHDQFPDQQNHEPTPTERFRADAVWTLAQAICAGRGIDPALATNRTDIAEFQRTLASGADVNKSPLMSGWRRDVIGAPLCDLLSGKRQISAAWRDDALKTVVSDSA